MLGLFYFLHEVSFKAVQILGLDDALQIQAIFPVFFHLHAATLPHGSGKAQLVVGQQHPDGVHPAALLAGLTLFALVGCSAGSKADSAAPKDYSQILHDARTDEDNEYDMIFTKGEDGKFTAIDGYSAEYEAGQLDDEVRSILLPLLNLEDDMYTDLAASISAMMVRSYAVAIVKPAEGKTDAVKSALEAYVTSEQQSMEHYLEDQYQIAKAATVTVAPTGEVILVCAENHDTLLDNIEKALAA